jgi:enterochelin esterase-like enzyme
LLGALVCALLVLLPLSGCGGGGDGASAQPVGRVLSASVISSHTGYAYNIDIYLPASFDTGSASYPTICVLDGDSRFVGTDTRFTNFKSILQRRGTNAILIGIGGTERRQTDYNFPGAYAYHDFIALELIPYVESRFRSDPNKRMLSGLSTSGTFAATALFIEAPNQLVFSYFLSAEGAFWQQLSLVQDLEQQMFVALAGKSLPVTLILARSTGVGPTNTTYVHDLYERMAARHYVGLTLLETAFPYSHAEMDDPSFEDAIARLLG